MTVEMGSDGSTLENQSRLERLCDTLAIVSRGIEEPTMIMQAANVTWDNLVAYLEVLVRKGLLVKEEGPEPRYIVTSAGRTILGLYVSLRNGLELSETDTLTPESLSSALKLPFKTEEDGSRASNLESRLFRLGLRKLGNHAVGKTGVDHTFDIVAKGRDGAMYGYVVLKDVSEQQVLGLFVKQLDTGLNLRVIYTGTVTRAAQTLADNYSIRLEKWRDEADRNQTEVRGLELVRFSGRRLLLEVDPNIGYESAVGMVISDFLDDGQSAFLFTWKGSPIYEAVSGMSGLKVYTMTSQVSYTKQIQGKDEFLIPQSDQAILLDEIGKAMESRPKQGVVILFDSMSDMMVLNGFEYTYEFQRRMSELTSASGVTTISILKRHSHDPKVDNLIKGIYGTHLVYDSAGLRATR